MNALLNLIGLLALTIGLSLLNLLILTKMWAIIMVGNFGVPQIGMWKMFALTWMLSGMTLKVRNEDMETEKTDIKKQVKKSIMTTLTLLALWGIAALIF